MGVIASIKHAKYLYLDTNLFIYFFENNLNFSSKIEEILNFAAQNNQVIICSPLLFTELLVQPFLDKNTHLIQAYQNLTYTLPNLKVAQLSLESSFIAAELRAKYNLRTPDALHLATAISNQVNVFISMDKKLKNISEIKIITLED